MVVVEVTCAVYVVLVGIATIPVVAKDVVGVVMAMSVDILVVPVVVMMFLVFATGVMEGRFCVWCVCCKAGCYRCLGVCWPLSLHPGFVEAGSFVVGVFAVEGVVVVAIASAVVVAHFVVVALVVVRVPCVVHVVVAMIVTVPVCVAAVVIAVVLSVVVV